MKGETHAVIGVAITTTLMATGYMKPEIFPVAAAAIASLLPDIDHDKATINVRLGINKGSYLLLAAALIYYVQTPWAYASAVILAVVGLSRHRAITHSLLAIVVLFGLTMNLQSGIRIGLMVGYSSHLFTDFFTKQGIEIFYPIKKNYKAPVTITTGKWAESIVGGLATILVVLNGWKLLPTLHTLLSKILVSGGLFS